MGGRSSDWHSTRSGATATAACCASGLFPRLLAAAPDDYADASGTSIDPARVWSLLMRNEKPGGHGERPGAVGMIDAAVWDIVAKMEDRPLWATLAERFNRGEANRNVMVYASGGHYRPQDDLDLLRQEIAASVAAGHRRFKLKVGGAALQDDLRRIEAALTLLGNDGSRLAVDAGGSFDRETAFRTFEALCPYGLAWIEEPADPLDFELHRELAGTFDDPIATGENLFSAADVRNLLRYGGLRSQSDWLQMDVSLSYGIEGYRRMLTAANALGWNNRRMLPHAGHLLALHVVAGLGLGGHETASDPDSLFGAFPESMTVNDGHVALDDLPGVGLERHPRLREVFRPLLP